MYLSRGMCWREGGYKTDSGRPSDPFSTPVPLHHCDHRWHRSVSTNSTGKMQVVQEKCRWPCAGHPAAFADCEQLCQARAWPAAAPSRSRKLGHRFRLSLRAVSLHLNIKVAVQKKKEGKKFVRKKKRNAGTDEQREFRGMGYCSGAVGTVKCLYGFVPLRSLCS